MSSHLEVVDDRLAIEEVIGDNEKVPSRENHRRSVN